MDDHAPNFDYAFGGSSASWNPALRPDSDVPASLDRGLLEKTHVAADETETLADLPSTAPTQKQPKARPMSQLEPLSKESWPAEDNSDDDFFDRYGAPADAAVASELEQASVADASFVRTAENIVHNATVDDTESPAPPQVTRQESINTVLNNLPANSLGEPQSTATPVEPKDSNVYEYESRNFMEEAIADDVRAPLIEDVDTPAVEDPWGAEGNDFDLGVKEQTLEQIGGDDTFDGHQTARGTSSLQESVVDASWTQLGQSTEPAAVQDLGPFKPLGSAAEQPANDASLDWGDSNGMDFEIGGPVAAHRESVPIQEPEATAAPKDAAFDWGLDDDQDFDFGGMSAQPGNGLTNGQAAVHDVPAGTTQLPATDDLAAAWGAVLDDDEPLDQGAFAFDDDEGFLNDDSTTAANQTSSEPFYAQPGSAQPTVPTASKYAPQGSNEPAPAPPVQNLYAPSGNLFTDLSQQPQRPDPPRSASTSYGRYGQQPTYAAAYGAQPSRPAASSAQSFTDKGKSGYASPYDLPEDLAPRKRAAAPVKPAPFQAVQPPPRSTSMGQSHRPPPVSIASVSAVPGQPAQSPANAYGGMPRSASTTTPTSAGQNFFADLPMVPKARPSSQLGRNGTTPGAIPDRYTPPSAAMPPPAHSQPPILPAGMPNFQPPERLPLLPNIPTQPPQPAKPMAPPPTTSRYSPAPAAAPTGPASSAPPAVNAAVAPPVNSRYSPAPGATNSRTSTGPPPGPPNHHLPRSLSQDALNKPAMPFAPRTSSPLAQHRTPPQSRQASMSTALPPVRELPSAGEQPTTGGLYSPELSSEPANFSTISPPYAPQQRSTPPPPRSGPPSTTSSPRKSRSYQPTHASGYQPTSLATATSVSEPPVFSPPPRARTQSPGAHTKQPRTLMQPIIERPASVAAPQSPSASSATASISAALSHRRAMSKDIDYIAPEDVRVHDPLERWKGCPLFVWGPGGRVVTSIPKHIPRYTAGHLGPRMLSTAGELRFRSTKDFLPLQEGLTRFPGPLRGKSKKKDVLAWLKNEVETMIKSQLEYVPDRDGKRLEEKILLWKILTVFVEHDGALEGNPAVELAVRKALDLDTETGAAGFSPADLANHANGIAPSVDLEPVNPAAVSQLKKFLTRGERKEAAFHAVDQRLWAHALLISSTLPDKDVWGQVVQEFIRKEVRKSGTDTEALAALYEVFAGNWEESISELVPASTRAGFQMVNVGGADTQKNALDGLNKWKETLSLIISNRTQGDAQALLSLGKLLAGYGRVEAAHLCFLFARSALYMGGIDDAQSTVVLLGADHLANPSSLANDLESIILSEVYEFALTLAVPTTVPLPHLQAYKLQHAYLLAEHGHLIEAQAYCDALGTIFTAKGPKSPYYNPTLLSHLDSLAQQLSQSAKDDSTSSWISRPTMSKVSSSLTSKLMSFVAGDESEDQSPTSTPQGAADMGPFGGIQSAESPVASARASETNLYAAYMNGGAPPPPASIPPAGASRYAPSYTPSPLHSQDSLPKGGAYQPKSSYTSTRASQENLLGHRSVSDNKPVAATGMQRVLSAQYGPGAQYSPSPLSSSAPAKDYFPAAAKSAATDERPSTSPYGAYQPVPLQQTERKASLQPSPQFEGYQPGTPEPEQYGYGYNPPPPQPPSEEPAAGAGHAAQANSYEPPSISYEPPSSGGYEPPTISASGYEPPTYTPYEPEPEAGSDAEGDDQKPKPKKKSFMDDDDGDDDLAARAAALKKQKQSDADRIAEENFRKAAEADAARDAPSSSQKKGWFSFGWGGSKKPADLSSAGASEPKVHKANLGEASSFVYDPDLKQWVNKKAGASAAEASAPTPPPPKGGPPSRSASAGSAPAPSPALGGGPPPRSNSRPQTATSQGSRAGTPSIGLGVGGETMSRDPSSTGGAGPMKTLPGQPGLSRPPSMAQLTGGAAGGSAAGGPPSRPGTSMSNASDIDDLLGAAGTRKGGTVRKGKRGNRYVDVMGK